jgi:hypothetical protein
MIEQLEEHGINHIFWLNAGRIGVVCYLTPNLD